MEVAVLVYDGVSASEALGPWEVLRHLPGATCRFVAEKPGGRLAHQPARRLDASATLEQVGWADVLIVPGGFGCGGRALARAIQDDLELADDGSSDPDVAPWTDTTDLPPYFQLAESATHHRSRPLWDRLRMRPTATC